MHAVIERVWKCTWRPLASEFGVALGGHDQGRLEEYLKAVNPEAVVHEGEATSADTLFIS